MRVGSFALLFSTVAGLAAAAVPHRRSTDTCANIDLSIKLLLLDLNVQVCACLGGVDALIAGNANLQLAVLTLGAPAMKNKVVDAARLTTGKTSVRARTQTMRSLNAQVAIWTCRVSKCKDKWAVSEDGGSCEALV
ncbi:hypothetical protein FRC07_007920 [Ceratobasidium sp. 392]|nr:hypothetical protein FRC07_007920 [Ceratobasidium sp. 392]